MCVSLSLFLSGDRPKLYYHTRATIKPGSHWLIDYGKESMACPFLKRTSVFVHTRALLLNVGGERRDEVEPIKPISSVLLKVQQMLHTHTHTHSSPVCLCGRQERREGRRGDRLTSTGNVSFVKLRMMTPLVPVTTSKSRNSAWPPLATASERSIS